MNLQKERGSGGGVSAASPMIKSVKMMEKMEKKVCVVRIAHLSLVGSFCFILGFLLNSWKDNLVILAIESLFPYQKPILLDFLRDNITNLAIKFVFPYQRPILPYSGFLF